LSKKSQDMKMYKCTAVGPQNNGKVQKCAFTEMLPSGYEADTYHCPICASLLAEVKELDN